MLIKYIILILYSMIESSMTWLLDPSKTTSVWYSVPFIQCDIGIFLFYYNMLTYGASIFSNVVSWNTKTFAMKGFGKKVTSFLKKDIIGFIFCTPMSLAEIICRWRYYTRDIFFFKKKHQFVCLVDEHSISAKTPDLLNRSLVLENYVFLNHPWFTERNISILWKYIQLQP